MYLMSIEHVGGQSRGWENARKKRNGCQGRQPFAGKVSADLIWPDGQEDRSATAGDEHQDRAVAGFFKGGLDGIDRVHGLAVYFKNDIAFRYTGIGGRSGRIDIRYDEAIGIGFKAKLFRDLRCYRLKSKSK